MGGVMRHFFILRTQLHNCFGLGLPADAESRATRMIASHFGCPVLAEGVPRHSSTLSNIGRLFLTLAVLTYVSRSHVWSF